MALYAKTEENQNFCFFILKLPQKPNKSRKLYSPMVPSLLTLLNLIVYL